MISRRDNLLNRPWLERRYENHRRKVQTALPAIDNKPPASRIHVALKLKKYQKESERCKKIEQDNLILLRRLNYTMRTNRVDNYWATPQPNFLSRIAMYDSITPKIEDIEIDELSEKTSRSTSGRRAKCVACSPQKTEEAKIPEERVPWEPTKPSLRRTRSKSVPVHKSENLPAIKEEKSDLSTSSHSPPVRPKTSLPSTIKKSAKTKERDFSALSPQSIILTRGSLKLEVNFPSDTFVKFQSGNSEKILMQGLCTCNKPTNVVY